MLNVQLLADLPFEPVTIAQLALQCEIDSEFTGDNTLMQIYISAARKCVEKIMRRRLFNQTLQRTLDNFPLAASFDYSPSPADRWNWPVYGGMWNRLVIDLPGGYVIQLPAINYLDQNGELQTLATSMYQADLSGDVCRLTPGNGASSALVWPWQGNYLPGSVRITYQTGNFVRSVTDSFQVPNASPFTYDLGKPNCTLVQSVAYAEGVLESGWSVTYQSQMSMGNTVLTLPASLAGQNLVVTYCIANLPNDVLNAILLLGAHFYRNREAATDLDLKDLPSGIGALLGDHIVEWTDYRPC